MTYGMGLDSLGRVLQNIDLFLLLCMLNFSLDQMKCSLLISKYAPKTRKQPLYNRIMSQHGTAVPTPP